MLKKTDKSTLIKAIFEIVKHIPKGRATSYGAIAKAIGYPNLSRFVGHTLANCKSDEKIPAHRVVNSQGILSAQGVFKSMQQQLENEGIVIINNKIKNWSIIFWDPLNEINI